MEKPAIIWDFDGTILPLAPFDSEQSLLRYRMNQTEKPFGLLKKAYVKTIIYADRPTGKKEERADPYSVQVNNGNFRMLKADWNFAFLDEHRLYPFSTYKDQVDAAAGAFNQLTKKRVARRIT